MAKKKMNALEVAQSPLWPTAIKSRYRDGRIRTINDGVWLVRKIPLMPMTDAKSDEERYAAGVPIMNATQELAHITATFGKNRALNKSGYRVVKFLSINTPVLYRAPKDHPIRSKLNEWFGDKVVREKICVMAVKLVDSLGAGRDIKGAMDSAWQSFVTGGIPLEDFDRDAAIVSNALHRAGLVAPDEGEMRILDAWWNHGSHSDTPFMPHSDHLHVFSDTDSMAIADRAGLDDCSKWPRMQGQFSVSFAAVSSVDIEPTDKFTAISPEASWASQLTQSGALVVSISGRIEPAKQTRSELRRNRKKYMEDIKERQEQGAMSQADEEEHHGMLQSMEGAYAGRGAPATIVDCSIVVGFSGKKDFSLMGNDSIVELNPMINRQPQAMAETWLGSSVRANPYAQELPMTTIAASGINDLSRVGDKSGASVGLTERDSRMAYLSPTAASNKDGLPVALVPGATGSGKSLLLLWLAHQFSLMKRPNIIIDPKALGVNTPIVTPSGCKTIAELQPGDEIIDSTGNVHQVTSKSKIFTEDETTVYRVHTGDGQSTIADGAHRWIIVDGGNRRVMTTSQILTEYGEHPFATGDICLPMPEPLVGRETDLPVEPKTLGSWIAGDDVGDTVSAVWPEMAARSPESRMIPAAYHRSSIAQRQSLFAPILARLGTVAGSGRVTIDMTASVAKDDLVDFIRTFGYRVFTTDEAITFVADRTLNVLTDDGSALPESVPDSERAMPVVSISEVDYEPVQCISVDSPDHSYLTGGFLVTHNTGSDHSQAVLASGGQIASLDDISKSDGVFDPIRFMMKQNTDKGEAGSVQSAADLAASAILQINPFGRDADDYEVLLNRGLLFGVDNGAQCTGQALSFVEANLGELAHTDRDREDFIQIISRIRQATHSPAIRSVIGMDPTTAPLGVAEGTTLIKVGESHLDLPQPGHDPQSMQQRAAMALVRMMVYGSAMALTGRGGVLHLDEAWTFLQSSASEVERLGRLARSQEVLPILYSQRVKDAVDAGLSGYISRGLIMHIKDETEARLACQLFNLEPTEERIGRITAEDHISNGGQLIPNFNSLKALREGGEDEAGEVIRGAVALYADLSGERAVPTEINIPSEFFELISTNPLDIARRNERLHQRDVSKMAV